MKLNLRQLKAALQMMQQYNITELKTQDLELRRAQEGKQERYESTPATKQPKSKLDQLVSNDIDE